MNSNTSSNGFQRSNQLQPTANSPAFSHRGDTPPYPVNHLYAQQLQRDLVAIQSAYPQLTPQQYQYILHAKNRGAMEALSRRQNCATRIPGVFRSAISQNGRMEPSSIPLSRTESCPLPGPASAKSHLMRRQHSSVDPSTIPESLLEDLATRAAGSHHSQSFHIHHDPIDPANVNNTMCLVPTLAPSFPPQGLPIQHISAPATGTSYTYSSCIPSAVVGYLSQNSRDDPFSSVRQTRCPYVAEQQAICNLSVHGVSGDIGFEGLGLSQAGIATHVSPPLTLPYTIDMNNAAFVAPRMETQLSTSTLFDSTSTNPDLESADEFMVSDMDMGKDGNEELQAELAGLVNMSTSQLTVRDNPGVLMLPAPHSTGALSLSTFPADLHQLPELTDTVETPNSPAQMSRQASSADSFAQHFSVGAHPRSTGPLDVLTAPDMGREWSDLSNPAIPTFSTGEATSFDNQLRRKRSRHPAPEDIEMLLKGTGVDTGVPASHSQYVDGRAGAMEESGAWSGFPQGAWQGLYPQLSLVADDESSLAQVDRDLYRESGLDEETYNPTKLRRVDGQEFGEARAHAKTQVEAAALQNLNSSSSANFPAFVATTVPLPAFDDHLIMTKSTIGSRSHAAQPVTGNTQQVVTATTTTVTTRTVDVFHNMDTAKDVTRPVTRPSASTGPAGPVPSKHYIRRPHPRVFCDQCNDVSHGFRGDHELRRHKDRLHAKTKKVWVTKDISPDGDFLAGCKACKRGKHYFADYNAAAHLRRQHFCKEGRRGKSRKERDEKRKSNVEKIRSKLEKWGIDWKEDGPDSARGGASRTGEEFTLKFLRKWMQQIEIPRTQYEGLVPEAMSEEDDENEESDEVKEQEPGVKGNRASGGRKGLSSAAVTAVDVRRKERASQKSTAGSESTFSSSTHHPEMIECNQSPFQPPPPYDHIDAVTSASLPPHILQSQLQRELQVLIEPTLGRIDLSLDSFYNLQNGHG